MPWPPPAYTLEAAMPSSILEAMVVVADVASAPPPGMAAMTVFNPIVAMSRCCSFLPVSTCRGEGRDGGCVCEHKSPMVVMSRCGSLFQASS